MLAVQVFLFATKTDVFVDESFTVVLSTNNEHGWTRFFAEDVPVTAVEMRDALYAFDGSLTGTLRDLWQLHLDNRDPPHTNLYYSLFRLSLLGLDSNHLEDILFRAAILHLVLACVAYFLFCRLCLVVLESTRARVLALILAFFCGASLSNVLLFREYLLQEICFVGIALAFWKLLPILEGKVVLSGPDKLRTALLHGLLVALTLLSGYYSLLYLFVFFVNMAWQGARHNRDFLKVLLLVCLFATALTLLSYGKFLDGLFSEHAAGAGARLGQGLGHEILAGLENLFYVVDESFFFVPGLALVFLVAWQRRKDHLFSSPFWKVLLAAASFFAVGALVLDPWKTTRYIYPVFPLCALLVAHIFDEREQGEGNDLGSGANGEKRPKALPGPLANKWVQDSILVGSMLLSLILFPLKYHRFGLDEVPDAGWIVAEKTRPDLVAALPPHLEGTWRFRNACQAPSWYENLPSGTHLFVYRECLGPEVDVLVRCGKEAIHRFELCERK